MRTNLLLPESELSRFSALDSWSDRLEALHAQQQQSWELLKKGYESLTAMKLNIFEVGGWKHVVQWNPGRLTSSSARVDEKSIRERKCFLCPENLPEEQRGLLYENEFVILCNPFPIFPEHFTISHVRHASQQISGSFEALLRLSKDLSDRYMLLYNGPKCGASAPDHLHFQAGNKGFLPIEEEYESLITSAGEKIADSGGLLTFAVGDFLRPFISFESDDMTALLEAFRLFYYATTRQSGNEDEPLMNILSSFQDGEWRVIVFPRAKHRPSFFCEEGEKRMLVSPAAVDMGGVITVPLERDFVRMSEGHLVHMFHEVSLSREQFSDLVRSLASAFSTL